MDLDTALQMTPGGDGWRAVVPAGWGQGRTTYGGLVGGYLARAACAGTDRGVQSVDVYFLEPVPAGPITLRQTGLRAGKHLSHVETSLFVGDRLSAVGRFLMADFAPGMYDTVPHPPVPERSLEDSPVMPYIEGITPEFTQHFDLRYGEGDVPFSGSERAVAGGFVRNHGAATGVAAMLSHIDVWPPPVLALASSPVAASTVRWHVQFHADVADADGQQWSWVRDSSTWRSGRLATVTGSLVRDGRSVAYCEQTVAMYL